MASLSRSIVIQAPPDIVLAYVSQPEAMAEWLPSMVEVRNVLGAGEGQQYEWTYKMAGMLLRGQSTIVEYDPNKRAVHQSIGTINSTWTFSVEPQQEGTRFTAEIEYLVPVPVLGKLAERLAVRRDARELGIAFENVKEALEV